LFLQARTAIAAAGAVDLNHPFVSVIGKLGAADSDGSTGNFQHVPSVSFNAAQVGRRQTRDGMSNILNASFRNAKC
jgi:hypothetical protein